jgi:hypothetical protein
MFVPIYGMVWYYGKDLFRTTQRILMWFFLIDTMIQEQGLYAYNIHNIVEKHFSISITPVRNRGGSLVLLYLNNFIPYGSTCRLFIVLLVFKE